MSENLLLVLGGIGLFLFGMKVMTDSLREAAGGSLRRFLTRFTTTPMSGVATGAAATALVQSSSATTVMTVGFVGAGLLSFPHSLGVLYGANIGTTFTGWMIVLLGFKMQLGTIALPGLFLSSLVFLLTNGALARTGRAVAGLCLLFIGLDMMQEGAANYGDGLSLDMFPATGVFALVNLMLAGLAMTVVMQSSSAAVAIALVLLGSGAIQLEQAAAMVIGMNLGTTVTALIATIGGARTMRQTAVANMLFNVGTALIALPLLQVGGGGFLSAAARFGDQTALVLFHSAFNILGTTVFLPLTPRFATFVQRLIPSDTLGLTTGLDRALLQEAGAAMDVAHTCIARTVSRAFDALGRALRSGGDLRGLSAVRHQIEPALEELEDFVSRIQIPDDKPNERVRHAALLHQIDHLHRMLRRMEKTAMIPVLLADEELSRPARYFGVLLTRSAEAGKAAQMADRIAWLAQLVTRRSKRHRRATLLREHIGLITVNEMFDRTDAMRWLDRTVHHADRIAQYDIIAAQQPSDTLPQR